MPATIEDIMSLLEPQPVEMRHVSFCGNCSEIAEFLMWADMSGIELFYDDKEHFYTAEKSHIKKMDSKAAQTFIDLYWDWSRSPRTISFPIFVSAEELSLITLKYGEKVSPFS